MPSVQVELFFPKVYIAYIAFWFISLPSHLQTGISERMSSAPEKSWASSWSGPEPGYCVPCAGLVLQATKCHPQPATAFLVSSGAGYRQLNGLASPEGGKFDQY